MTFDLPPELGLSEPVPDAFGYQLTVTEPVGRAHSVSFSEPIEAPLLKELVQAVRSAARG